MSELEKDLLTLRLLSNAPHEVREMARSRLRSGTRSRGAYRRGDMFEKRRQLAEAWARYCERGEDGGAVVSLRA